MTNKNDQRILELKKQIASKKEELGKSTRFNPVTNCSLELEGVRVNLNAQSKTDLTMLLVKLNSYKLSVADLGLGRLDIGGYDITEWISDVKSKLDILNRKDEEQKLRVMESKLAKLLSEDKKVELEIDEIESLLKEN